jgi:RNA polymerase sigma-70 factor (sigma-E family)
MDVMRDEAEAAGHDLAALYQRHHTALLRLAGVLLGDRAGAEDVVQEAFVRVHGTLSKPRDDAAAKAYLRTTVVNLCRSRMRHAGVVRRWRPERPRPVQQPDERAVLNDDQRAVLDAIRALPARQRECIVLRFYERMSDAEIGAVLGVSAGSVKTHIQRGKAALAEKLEDRR